MNKTLSKHIGSTIAGACLTMVTDLAVAGTTMYNNYNAYASQQASDFNSNGTDGWVYGFGNGPGQETPSFSGTASSSTLPFGYSGGSILNWAAELTGSGDSVTVSSLDAHTRYGVWADIDVAGGSWSDNSSGDNGASGWRHNVDFGLFKSQIDTDITLHGVGITNSDHFGFTIFKGMDTSNSAYSHHGGWNSGNNASGLSSNSLPDGGTTFSVSDIVAYSIGGSNPQNISDISFHANADQIYTIVMGGYRDADWGTTSDGYALTISAVPIPGAVWLFGSALAGLAGLRRRRTV